MLSVCDDADARPIVACWARRLAMEDENRPQGDCSNKRLRRERSDQRKWALADHVEASVLSVCLIGRTSKDIA
jgi:hypothetical protein